MFWQDHPKTFPLLILIAGLYSLKFFTLLVYRKRNHIRGKDNFIIGINTIYYIFLSALMIILVMVLLKVNIREFFTSISIIAAAIAIVSKDYIANAINGMILMFNNQISIGDHIRVGPHKGKITHISLLNLQIINEEGDLVYIPNTSVLSMEIVNYTKTESRKVSMEFTADPAYAESVEELESLFASALENNPNIEKNTFQLTALEVHRRRVRFRAEAILKVRDIQTEKQFKRVLINTWFQRIRQVNRS